jgi:hypothetical protein
MSMVRSRNDMLTERLTSEKPPGVGHRLNFGVAEPIDDVEGHTSTKCQRVCLRELPPETHALSLREHPTRHANRDGRP